MAFVSKIFRHLKFYALPILSGIMVGTSYIPFIPWAVLFCYVPLWYFTLIKAKTWRQVFWAGWKTQFVFAMIGFYWIAETAHDFGYLPWSISILVLLIFAILMHIYVPLGLSFIFWISKKYNLHRGATILLFATVLVFFEIFWPGLFPFNMGYPLLWIKSPLAQWADTIGFQGLSFAMYLINAWILWASLEKNKITSKVSMVVVPILLVVFSGMGLQKAKDWKLRENAELKALVVQGNIGNNDKRATEQGEEPESVLETFFNLTRQGLQTYPDSRLVIWPETAFNHFLDDIESASLWYQTFSNFGKEIQKPILTGAFSRDSHPSSSSIGIYNALFLFDENGEPLQKPYRKTELLAFGETLPFLDKFPMIAKYNPSGPGFAHGAGPMILAYRDLKLGPQICYESLDPYFSAKLAHLGADILVNVTNDSWFGEKTEPLQHLYMTLGRGLENRRPLLRSTNTGISSAILADGTVLQKGPLNQKWFGQFVIPYERNAPITFYAKYGYRLWILVVSLILGCIFFGRQRRDARI